MRPRSFPKAITKVQTDTTWLFDHARGSTAPIGFNRSVFGGATCWLKGLTVGLVVGVVTSDHGFVLRGPL